MPPGLRAEAAADRTKAWADFKAAVLASEPPTKAKSEPVEKAV